MGLRACKLIKEFAFRDVCPVEVYPCDIDGDGQLELIWLESAGIYQSKVYLNTSMPQIPASNRSVFSLTATNLEGEILWQNILKRPDRPDYYTHVADQMLWPGDFDEDGHLKLVAINQDRLMSIDAKSGNIKKIAKLPADNFNLVRGYKAANGSGRLLVQNQERSYPPHYYGNPGVLVQGQDLSFVTELADVIGSGHSPRIFCPNENSGDLLIIGYSMFDSNGMKIAEMPFERKKGGFSDIPGPIWCHSCQMGRTSPCPDYCPPAEHVDQCAIRDINNDNKKEIVFAGSNCIYVTDDRLKLLWRYPAEHPQHVLLGNFYTGNRPTPIIIFEATNPPKIEAFDATGKLIKTSVIEMNWPVGKPEGVRDRMHGPEGILRMPQGGLRGEDVIVADECGWPLILNPDGTKAVDLPCPDSSRQPPVVSGRGHDGHGYGYRVRIADFNNDGQVEILVHDRRYCWLFSFPFTADAISDEQRRIQPYTGQQLRGNYNKNSAS